ncbi:Hypothetical protein, putative [Bodo saltans]|uniref:Uncharacterized protein n=1 Tax=Bodo saltans TaxID=75058 RepID=A0A0S4J3U0_BODSA|nr:Hypothetical protein, putative [Bodo saltans]|eukprot:CUG74310.1 Hypothetical protein, putative [Bodo saltans]
MFPSRKISAALSLTSSTHGVLPVIMCSAVQPGNMNAKLEVTEVVSGHHAVAMFRVSVLPEPKCDVKDGLHFSRL